MPAGVLVMRPVPLIVACRWTESTTVDCVGGHTYIVLLATAYTWPNGPMAGEEPPPRDQGKEATCAKVLTSKVVKPPALDTYR
jgi:hypothetical protein